MNHLVPGVLLISDPFLKDPNFKRTAILLCEHQEEGSLGFILNKASGLLLEDIIENAAGLKIPVFEGGPVQHNTLHFVHRKPELITGSMQINDHIYWGGDFEQVLSLLHASTLNEKDIRFFIGYSGWDKQQLIDELEEKSWIIGNVDSNAVFNNNTGMLWKKVLYDLGGEYRQMANYPIDPRLN